jgi:hypothetical protein
VLMSYEAEAEPVKRTKLHQARLLFVSPEYAKPYQRKLEHARQTLYNRLQLQNSFASNVYNLLKLFNRKPVTSATLIDKWINHNLL